MPYVSEATLSDDLTLIYVFKYLYSVLLGYSLGATPDVLFVVIALTLEQLISVNLQQLQEDLRYHKGKQEPELLRSISQKTKTHFQLCKSVDKLAVTYCEYHGLNFIMNMLAFGLLLYFGLDMVLERRPKEDVIIHLMDAAVVCSRMLIVYEAAVRPQIKVHSRVPWWKAKSTGGLHRRPRTYYNSTY